MAKKRYHIVWNSRKTEGFITDDDADAEFARSGTQMSGCLSTLADAFRDCYGDEDEEQPAQTVTIEV